MSSNQPSRGNVARTGGLCRPLAIVAGGAPGGVPPGARAVVHAVVLGLSLAVVAMPAPAQASEVVKLARLLLTGKRAPSQPATSPTPAPAERGSSSDASGPQSRAGDADAEPAPHRRAEASVTTHPGTTMME